MEIDLTTGEVIADTEVIEDTEPKKGKGKETTEPPKFNCRITSEQNEKINLWSKEHGVNKTGVFHLMMDTFEKENLKGTVADRGKEIDTFAATVDSLLKMYSGSLLINANSEAALREKHDKELETKNAIILKLEQDKKDFIDKINEFKKLETNNIELNKTIVALTEEVTNLKETNNTLTKYNKKVDEEIEEFKKYKIENVKLEKDIKELNNTIDIQNKDINNKNLENKNLKKEIELLDKTIAQNKELYRQLQCTVEKERDRLIQDINNLNAEHKNNIKEQRKELKQEHTQAINILKQENIEAINILKTEHENTLSKARETLKQERDTYKINKEKFFEENNKLKEEINKLKLNSK